MGGVLLCTIPPIIISYVKKPEWQDPARPLASLYVWSHSYPTLPYTYYIPTSRSRSRSCSHSAQILYSILFDYVSIVWDLILLARSLSFIHSSSGVSWGVPLRVSALVK